MAVVLFAGVGGSGSYRLSEGGHNLNWYKEKRGLRGRKLSLSATTLEFFSLVSDTQAVQPGK